MQNDGYRNDRYRRHDPRPHDRDEELRAARGYGQDDREHPGIVSDRDWAGPSDYGRGDYERRDYGPGDYGRRDYGSDDDRLRSHRRGGEAFYRDEPSRWGRDDERGRGPGGFGSAAYRDEGSGRRGYGGGSEYRPQYFGGAGYGEDRHEGRAPDAGGLGRMDHGPGGNQGRPGAGHGGGYYGAAGYSQNDAYAQGGQHRGRGPKGYSRSDERVREDVSDRLADDDMVDASDIEVQVSQGEVTLSGHVDSREAKRRAEDCAESVSGVRHVQNNLRVKTDGWASGASSSGSTGTGWSGSSSSGSSSSSSGLSGSGLSSSGTGSAGSGAESGAAGGASDGDTTSAPRS